MGLLLVGAAVAWAVWVYRLPAAQRDDALGFWGFVLALVGVLVPLLLWLGRWHRRADLRPVDALAALLAQAVYGQWRKPQTSAAW